VDLKDGWHVFVAEATELAGEMERTETV